MYLGSVLFFSLCTISTVLSDDLDEFHDVSVRHNSIPPTVEEKILSTESAGIPSGANNGTISINSKTIYGDGNYTIEILLMILVVVWSINYLWGLGKNTVIADHWVAHNIDFLRGKFSHIGPGATAKEVGELQSPNLYFIESGKQFRIFLSGRRGFVGVTAHFEMRPRHDLFLSLLGLVAPAHDSVTLEAVLADKPTGAGWDPAMVVVCGKGKGKIAAIHKAHPVIKELTTLTAVPELSVPPGLVVHAEGADCARDVLAVVAPALRAKPEFVEEILVTDRNEQQCVGFEGTPARLVRVRLRLPGKAQMAELTALVEASFGLMDHVATLRLGAVAKAKVSKARSAIAEREERREQAQRQSTAARLKAEKQDRERELERERYEAMSAAERARHDEAEERRRKKEQQAKFRPKLK